MNKISFASDNYAGIHPHILQAITAANHTHVPAYGDDHFTANAIEKFKQQFGDDAEVFFVFNGTAANVTSLSALAHSYEAIICAEKAHIQVDECGAPEKFIGSKLLLVPAPQGKITVDGIRQHLQRVGDQHHVQPRVVSISQSTEFGTVYQPQEIAALANFAHENAMYLHMDGARIANAAAALKCDLRAITKDVGVDVLSFGGTKNGLMLGEAVVFLNPHLAKNFPFIRKQSMQLASKMRFIAVQFEALLTNNLWCQNAQHANAMAQLLAKELNQLGVKISYPVDANAVFAVLPRQTILQLQTEYYFYVWDEAQSEVRLMMSFDTLETDIHSFVAQLKAAL